MPHACQRRPSHCGLACGWRVKATRRKSVPERGGQPQEWQRAALFWLIKCSCAAFRCSKNTVPVKGTHLHIDSNEINVYSTSQKSSTTSLYAFFGFLSPARICHVSATTQTKHRPVLPETAVTSTLSAADNSDTQSS